MIDFIFLVSCLIFGVICWFIYETYIWPYYVSPLRQIPGPPSESLLYGHFKTLLTEESGETHLRWVKEYGDLVKYHGIFNRTIIMVADVKMVQEIVNRGYDFPKPQRVVDAVKHFLGHGLVLVEGETHKKQRKMMNPAFAHNNIKNMIPAFIRVGLTLKDLIDDKVNERESKIILTPYLLKAALDAIGLVGFNHEFNSLTSPSELAEAYDSLMNGKPDGLRIAINVSSAYIPFIRKIPITMNKKSNQAAKVIERETKKLIKEKYHDNKDDGNDLLSVLFNMNKTLPVEEKLTDDELRYQIMTFLLAGHETTSASVSWILYLLAQHPQEQDLLREELVKAFPDKSKINPTFEEINSLEYLNCVVKETLRLFPPVTVIQRVSTKDDVLCGHFIPKDTMIVFPIMTIHRLPSIWGPTADNFDPKRWLDPSLTKNVTNFNYLPFHTGNRSCIGNKIALNEIKIFSSILVRNFVFRPVEGLHIKKTVGVLSKPDPRLELAVSRVES